MPDDTGFASTWPADPLRELARQAALGTVTPPDESTAGWLARTDLLNTDDGGDACPTCHGKGTVAATYMQDLESRLTKLNQALINAVVQYGAAVQRYAASSGTGVLVEGRSGDSWYRARDRRFMAVQRIAHALRKAATP